MEKCDHGIDLGLGCPKCDNPRGKQLTIGLGLKMQATAGRGGGLPPRKMSVPTSRMLVAGELLNVIGRRPGEADADSRAIGGSDFLFRQSGRSRRGPSPNGVSSRVIGGVTFPFCRPRRRPTQGEEHYA